MTALAIPQAGWHVQGTESFAAGDLARTLAKFKSGVMEHLRTDASARQSRVINDLLEMAAENVHHPSVLATVPIAKQFLMGLPSELAAPELTVDSEGEIVFDWLGSAGEMLTVSLRADGRISYAVWRAPQDKEHGTKWFSGTVPGRILAVAREIAPARFS